jgi:hypothetical protein
MKKILYLLFYIILSSFLNAQEYNVYNQELLYKFDIGVKINQLGYSNSFNPGGEYPGPSAICFDEDGNLYIEDYWKNRIAVFNSEFEYIKQLLDKHDSRRDFEKSDLLEIYNKKILKHYIGFRLIIYSMQNQFEVYFTGTKYKDVIKSIPFVYSNDIIIISLRDGNIMSIPNLGPDWEENNKKILDYEETKALFKPGAMYNLKGLTLDDKNRIFLNGELLTRDYKVFYEYWKERFSRCGYEDNKKYLLSNWVSSKSASDMTYLGRDIADNYYWKCMYKYIAIYNPIQSFFYFFEYYYNKSKTLPAVHPSGDVYFLDYDENGVYLYRVKNVWDPEGRARWYRESGVKDIEPIEEAAHGAKATVTADSLRVCASSSLDAAVVGSLKKDEQVKILERSATKVTIDGITAYWYKIRRPSDGLTGWCFGRYLDVE